MCLAVLCSLRLYMVALNPNFDRSRMSPDFPKRVLRLQDVKSQSWPVMEDPLPPHFLQQ